MLKVAERWFERRALADGVTWLYEPHVDAFLRCNIWHVRGRDRDLIVDTGSGVSPLRGAIIDLIERPVVAAATHIHYDHVGGLHEFDVRLMHRIEARRMNPYREFHSLRVSDFPPSFRSYFSARSSDLGDLLVDALPTPGWKPEDYAIVSAAPTSLLVDGDVIDLGDRLIPGDAPAGAFTGQHRALGAKDRHSVFRATRSTTVRYSTSCLTAMSRTISAP